MTVVALGFVMSDQGNVNTWGNVHSGCCKKALGLKVQGNVKILGQLIQILRRLMSYTREVM